MKDEMALSRTRAKVGRLGRVGQLGPQGRVTITGVYLRTGKHHKEMFVDLADSQKVLEETLGSPNARCVLSIEKNKKKIKELIVFSNPDTGGYCVLRISNNDQFAEIISWHRAEEKYGNKKWNKN